MYTYGMRKLHINRIYRHFKGDYYLIEGVAKYSEDKSEMVIYRKLYDDGSLWVRPLDMFLSEVDHKKYPHVKQKYRFELQKINSVADKFEKIAHPPLGGGFFVQHIQLCGWRLPIIHELSSIVDERHEKECYASSDGDSDDESGHLFIPPYWCWSTSYGGLLMCEAMLKKQTISNP